MLATSQNQFRKLSLIPYLLIHKTNTRFSDNYNHMLFPGYYTNNRLHSYLLRNSDSKKEENSIRKRVASPYL